MNHTAARVLLLALAACGGEAQQGDEAQLDEAAMVRVTINGRQLGAAELQQFVATYRVQPAEGEYWYDARSGLWGLAGQAAAGFMLPGHDLGPLSPEASRGDSGVFLNGRQLPAGEVWAFASLLGSAIAPGRYWLDGAGSYGYEGYPVATGNLHAVMMARMQAGQFTAGGGDNFWSTRFSAGNSNVDNSQGYVSVPGVGPVSYGM